MPLALLRGTVTLLAVAVFAQPVLAGLFLGGDSAMIAVHAGVASAIELLALVQIIVAVVLWRPGRGPGWPVFASIGIFLAVFAQSAVGYAHVLAVHVPLGAAMFAGMLLLLVRVWRPGLGRGTRPATHSATQGNTS